MIEAPTVHEEALAVFAGRKNLRVCEPASSGAGTFDWKRVWGGFLIQERFVFDPSEEGWTIPTSRQPTLGEWADLRFAWAAVSSVKSNAILLAKEQMAKGNGPCNRERLRTRVKAWEDGEWVREAAVAYAEKQAARNVRAA